MRSYTDEFGAGTARTQNPWETTTNRQLEPDKLRKKPLWRIPIVWITAVVLLLVLLLSLFAYFLSTLFIPSTYKLNLRRLCGNYTVEITYEKRDDYSTVKGSTEILVFGNVIARPLTNGRYLYYEIEDGVLYKYVLSPTGWEKEECTDNIIGFSSESEMENVKTWKKLLSGLHYELVLGQPFVWRLKDDVDVGDLYGVTFTRERGRFVLTWGQDGYKCRATFKRFGCTGFTIPRELILKILFE